MSQAVLCAALHQYHDKYRRMVWAKGVKPLIARRGIPHGSGLGTHRWVIGQTIALLHTPYCLAISSTTSWASG
ncbi:hypothetical protein [Microtetraspora malaysiensis]|uniref:Transposase n=1 Tax=Microtetraspora malaysiensis TaxID=161358 RepID=A0ABW6T6F9_9ACTN